MGRWLPPLALLLLLGSHVTIADSNWTYSGPNGPSHWGGKCNVGLRQSPIDIVTGDAIKTDLGSLKFVKYDFAFPGTITNNGHSVQIKPLDRWKILLEGGDLQSTFVLEQMHFHWGAEHTIDGHRDALELHFVHYDTQFEDIGTAVQHPGGIAVVASLFELSNEDNNDLTPILESVPLISKWVGKNTAALRSKVMPYLLLPKDHTTYYRYDGSLTTPGCDESVRWFVLANKLTISDEQLSIFKNVWTHNGTALVSNFRPTQPLGDRKVYHHLDGYSAAARPASGLLCTCLSLLLVKLLSQ